MPSTSLLTASRAEAKAVRMSSMPAATASWIVARRTAFSEPPALSAMPFCHGAPTGTWCKTTSRMSMVCWTTAAVNSLPRSVVICEGMPRVLNQHSWKNLMTSSPLFSSSTLATWYLEAASTA